MILILSDIHFGKSTYDEERRKENDVVELLLSYEENLTGLYLLGDIFDHFIEYRHAMPKGFVRFMGLLAKLVDADVELTYFLGNHDPWHKDFFERELNATLIHDSLDQDFNGKRVHLTHGDGKSMSNGLYSTLKPVLRHKVPTTLYRYILPGDAGLGLARWWSRRFSAKETNMETVSLMRKYAFNKLSKAADIVIMGHCHHAELTSAPDGIYLNTGSWHDDRTFGILDQDISLLKWENNSSVTLESFPL